MISQRDRFVIESGKIERVEEWATNHEGNRVLLESQKTPIYKPAGELIGLVGISRDITDQKRVQDALRESEERFRKLLQDVPSIAVQGYATDGTTQYWNRASEDLYGYRAEETIGRNLLDLIIPPEIRRDVEGAITYMAESGEVIPASELLLMRKDGSRVSVFSSHTIVKIPGREQELFCLDIDLSEQKNAQEALNHSMSELRAIYNNAPVMMCLVDQDQRIHYANPAFSGFKGISGNDLIGGRACGVFGCVNAKEDPKGCGFARACKDCTLLQAIQDTFRTGSVHQNEEHSITIRCDGEQQNFTFLGSTALINSGNRTLLLLCLQDISSFKRAVEEKQSLEKQLLYAQKLESLGVMAGGIAHDFNNLLAVIIGHCSLVRMRPDDAEVHIPQIETAAERAAELCRQMLAYSGKTHLVQSRVDLKALVTEMVLLMTSAISQNSTIKLDLADTIPTISGDASQIRQVVMNLIINASEAIGEKQGEISILLAKTAIQAGRSDRDHLGKTIPPGWYNCLEVSDTGCGMDAETRQRIFEPFYTTKFTGRGLGMSAVLGIITAHKGSLQLVSQPGHGTNFKVYFPAENHDSEENKSIAPVALRADWKGSGTILLAEDEEQIQWLAKTMLEELGFTVISASNGREGLDLYQRHAAEIDLVVTDMGMPVMNGFEMFRELKKLRPDLPIIVSSGFGDADVTSKLGRDDIAGLIGKPYNFSEFSETLRRVVEDMQARAATIV
jgi:PAS domain S-box-containing protein